MLYPIIADMMSYPLSSKAEALFNKNWANVKGEDVSYLSEFIKMEGVAE